MNNLKNPLTACRLLLLATVCAALSLNQAAAQSAAERIDQAQDRVAAIQARAGRMGDLNAIENLQRSFGFYFDKMLWEHVLDLFADDATIEIGLSGVYQGKTRIREYLYALSGGTEGPLEGVLYNHMQLQPIITLANDGQSAQGRWRALILTGISGSGSGGTWGEGPYENEYIKEDGVWKISKLHWFATFMAPYEGGWLNANADTVREYSVPADVTPDAPPSLDYEPYPGVFTPPFHFPNPGSGEPVQ